MSKVLITGGNGFIGRRLCSKLSFSRREIKKLVRKINKSDSSEQYILELGADQVPEDVFESEKNQECAPEMDGKYSSLMAAKVSCYEDPTCTMLFQRTGQNEFVLCGTHPEKISSETGYTLYKKTGNNGYQRYASRRV